MESVVRRPLTVKDYCQLPEGPPHYQLVQGELIMSPSPTRFHQDICRNLVSLLDRFVEHHRLGVIYFAPLDVYLGSHDVFQPDVVFVSNERRSILSDRGIEGAPDLVIEILSPSTRTLDLGAKMQTYKTSGVREIWIVDPEGKTITVHGLQTDAGIQKAVYTDDDPVESQCLPGLQIRASALFRR